MATLKTLKTTQGMQAAKAAAADFYASGMDAWEKTSMNKGLKSASEIVAEFRKHTVAETHAHVLLTDAGHY